MKTSNFLISCNTLDELKQLYKTLAKQFHPDKGGNLIDMQNLNAEYDFMLAKILKASSFTEEQINDEFNIAQVYKEKIEALSNLDGIVIELAGTWLWVSGETRPVKDILKTNGFFWAKNKEQWFFRPEGQKSFNRKAFSMDQIRNKYGSKVMNKTCLS